MKYIRSIRVVSKNAYYLRHACLFIRLFAGINAALTEWISVKFDIENSYENLSRKSKSGSNRTKILCTIREYFNIFYCCLQHYITLKAPLRLIFHLVFSLSVDLSVCLSVFPYVCICQRSFHQTDLGEI
jgi:hypothetical protein